MLRFLIMALIVFFAVSLTANPFSFSVRSGVIIPDNEEYDSGVISGLTVNYYFNPAWELQLSFDYHRQSMTASRKIINPSNPHTALPKVPSEVTLTYIPVSLNLQYNVALDSRIKPILGGGIGLGFLNEDISILDPDYINNYRVFESYSGLNTIVWTGLKYDLNSRIDILSQIMYRYSRMSETIDLNPHGHLKEVETINGLGANLGFEYRF